MRLIEVDESNGFTIEEMSKPRILDLRRDENQNISATDYAYEGETKPNENADNQGWHGAVLKTEKGLIHIFPSDCNGVSDKDCIKVGEGYIPDPKKFKLVVSKGQPKFVPSSKKK